MLDFRLGNFTPETGCVHAASTNGGPWWPWWQSAVLQINGSGRQWRLVLPERQLDQNDDRDHPALELQKKAQLRSTNSCRLKIKRNYSGHFCFVLSRVSAYGVFSVNEARDFTLN